MYSLRALEGYREGRGARLEAGAGFGARARYRCPACLLIVTPDPALALGEAARRAFEALMLKNYEYQSDFARKYFADGRAQGLVDGRTEGLLEGELKPLVRQFERRLARPLSVDERARLTAGVRELGAERVGELVLDLTPEALTTWLASPSGH